MSLAEGIGVDIESAEPAGGYRLRLAFSDGHTVTVDFEPFLRSSRNPGVRDFLDAGRFASYEIAHGNLVWGDYELAFPITDLYDDDILHGCQQVSVEPAVAEEPAVYGRVDSRGGARK